MEKDKMMAHAIRQRDEALLLSLAAVWKSYLDQQSAAVARALMPSAIAAGSSRLWEPYRSAAALAIASLLTEAAHERFFRLYQSSLLPAAHDGKNDVSASCAAGAAGKSPVDPETCASASR